jgi:hypothetical protein
MLDKQQIICGFIGCVLFYLIHYLFREVRKAVPWLWQRVLKPWLGANAKKYEDFTDSLVGNKTAQIQVNIGANIIGVVWIMGTSILVVLGWVAGELADLFEASGLDASTCEALYEARLVSTVICVAGILLALWGFCVCMAHLSALDMARKKEQEQEGTKGDLAKGGSSGTERT